MATNHTNVLTSELRVYGNLIELKARRLAEGMLIGSGRSSRHGFGFDFDQLRPYQRGDDVRFVDWRASSRTNDLLVRQYFQERNRIIGILYDCSGSMSFQTTRESKQMVAAQAAALIAIIAERNADRVTAVGYANGPVWSLPLAKGRQQTRRLIEHIVSTRMSSSKTDITAALELMRSLVKQRMLIFVISDCIEPGMHKKIAQLQHRHEVVVVRVLDKRECSIANVGYVTIEDFETGEQLLINTAHESHAAGVVDTFVKEQEQALMRCGIDVGTVMPTDDSLRQIAGFLTKRVIG